MGTAAFTAAPHVHVVVLRDVLVYWYVGLVGVVWAVLGGPA